MQANVKFLFLIHVKGGRERERGECQESGVCCGVGGGNGSSRVVKCIVGKCGKIFLILKLQAELTLRPKTLGL